MTVSHRFANPLTLIETSLAMRLSGYARQSIR